FDETQNHRSADRLSYARNDDRGPNSPTQSATSIPDTGAARIGGEIFCVPPFIGQTQEPRLQRLPQNSDRLDRQARFSRRGRFSGSRSLRSLSSAAILFAPISEWDWSGNLCGLSHARGAPRGRSLRLRRAKQFKPAAK